MYIVRVEGSPQSLENCRAVLTEFAEPGLEVQADMTPQSSTSLVPIEVLTSGRSRSGFLMCNTAEGYAYAC